MIPNTDTGVEVISTLVGEETHDLSFDENSLAHLMAVLTDLYSDPEYAIIREYSTNALDSHREAGEARPIEVELPGPLSPFFKVKDYGVGLDPVAIRDVYSKYGASTKRGTNDQVGMLGLGCKSALTYTAQFTVTGVKDGVRCTVSISRDEDGGGSMTVVETAATSEPNGVEVVIPVRNASGIERKARDFFRYWEPNTVLVNGEPPEPITGIDLSDTMLVVNHGGYDNQHKVIMGNVPYPADVDVNLPGGYGLVARIPVGAVNFTPSREALHYTPKTKATLGEIEAAFAADALTAVQAEIDRAETRPDALAAYHHWSKVLPVPNHQPFTYRGETLPEEYAPTGDDAVRVTDNSYRRLSASSSVPRIDASTWHRTFWVQDYTLKLTPTHKRKLQQFIAARGLTSGEVTRFALLKGSLNGEAKWIGDNLIADWEDVAKVQLPRQSVPGRRYRLPGSYDVLVCGDDRYVGVASDDIETDWPLFYVNCERGHERWYGRILQEAFGDHTLVRLPSNRVAKFERTFPEAREAREAMREAVEAWQESLPIEVRAALVIHDAGDDSFAYLRHLDPERVNDPDLEAAIRLSQVDLTAALAKRKVFSSYAEEEDTTGWVDPLDNYPLTAALETWRTPREHELEHLYLYVNAVYAAKQ